MAYVNVAEWTPDHVVEWLRGLEDSILPYVHFFRYNDMNGNNLLNLTRDDLNLLHITKIGHQELILEGVDLLRKLHYGLNSETLQFMALKLGCEARSLYNDLKFYGTQEDIENVKQERVSTNTLSAAANILISVKSLISWLDRYPFAYQDQYEKIRKAVLTLSIELASTAQRDKFVEKPHLLIKNCSFTLAELCDKLVQDFNDSLIIQPASLDIATIKQKPDEEIGLHIQSTYSGIHVIGWIKPQSLAAKCAKIEQGDEIVQVNYQTVIGWQLKKLVHAMKEHPAEVHLTVKKRPRHTNILGQVIILRPYRIPSKKTAFGKVHKWSDGSLHIEDVYSTSNDSETPREDPNGDDDDDSAFLPNNTDQVKVSKESNPNFRKFACHSHATVQRRATVSGASPTVLKPPVSIDDLVHAIPVIKGKDNVSRSISHDPSNLNVPCETSCLSEDKFIDAKKSSSSDRNPEEVSKFSEKLDKMSESSGSESFSVVASNKMHSNSIVVEPINKDRNFLQTSEILFAQEEDYIILENKSLTKLKDDVYSHSEQPKYVKNNNHATNYQEISSKSSNTEHYHSEKYPEKTNTVPYSMEDKLCHEIYFCGRRASVQDISNEIADSRSSETNSVYLKKASKLPSDEEPETRNHKVNEPRGYQVVIVGGVPQKCALASKDTKSEFTMPQLKKKVASMNKIGNRRISCKDLGIGDCEGWLLKLKDKRSFFHGASQWSKRWMVLRNHYLYTYRDKSDTKAESLIYLCGSTVLPAIEYRRKFCFKIFQQSATLVFAADSQEDLCRWVKKMAIGVPSYCTNTDLNAGVYLKADTHSESESNFYSETDDSDDNNSKPEFDKNETKPNIKINYPLRETEQFSHSDNSKHGSSCSRSHVLWHQMNPLEKSYSESRGNQLLSVLDAKGNRVSYHRSLSYTDNMNPIPDNRGQDIVRKFSCNDAEITHSVPYKNNRDDETKIDQPTTWAASDEEYDMLTSSLGRQKPVAKEITPGLVARMAVSYSNLSQRNASVTNSTAKHVPQKTTVVPGYVAKISDSFDHLARKSNFDLPKCHQLTKSKSVYPQPPNENRPALGIPTTKRSASESHVTHYTGSSSHQKLSLSLSPQLNQKRNVTGNTETPDYQLSMLDREHQRLYGNKKISPGAIISSKPSDSKHTSSENRMKFFPDSSTFLETKPEVTISDDSKLYFKGPIYEKSKSLIFCGKSPVQDGSSNKIYSNVHQETRSNVPTTKTKECILGFKNQIQSVFRPQPKPIYPDFSKGIENIAFCSPDQAIDANICSSNENVRNRMSVNTSSSHVPPYTEVKSMSLTRNDSFEQPNSKSFKLFGSPKCMKKLSSPKLDKRNIFKSKKQSKELKRAEQKELATIQTERKIFGSPRLARAIFGSPRAQKKVITTVSSGVQTDSQTSECKPKVHDSNLESANKRPSDQAEHCSVELIKSSSNSSLNSEASSSVLSASTLGSHYYVEARMKSQGTVNMDRAAEDNCASGESYRMPMRPMMGTAMLGKRRLPSVSGESSISISSSKGSQEESFSEAVHTSTSNVQTEIERQRIQAESP